MVKENGGGDGSRAAFPVRAKPMPAGSPGGVCGAPKLLFFIPTHRLPRAAREIAHIASRGEKISKFRKIQQKKAAKAQKHGR